MPTPVPSIQSSQDYVEEDAQNGVVDDSTMAGVAPDSGKTSKRV